MRRPLVSLFALASFAFAGSCSTPAIPPPAPPQPVPPPAPAPTPTPAPAPAPPPRSGEWRDWPVTPGTWAYRQDGRGSIALYGVAGQDAELTLRCDRQAGQIFLSRRGGTGPAQVTVRTSSTLRTLAMQPAGGATPYLAASLGRTDNLVDAMGYSRGKFVVLGAGLPDLVVPAWSEILRVAEDCRGS